MKCSAPDCEDTAIIKGYCNVHYCRMQQYGRLHTIMRPKGTYSVNASGYTVLTRNGKRVYEHVVKAEQALGRKLPQGAVVHHMNNKPWDNDTPLNLVICPDQAYHLLLHRRAKELGYEDL